MQTVAGEVNAAEPRATAFFNRPSGAVESLMWTDNRPTPPVLPSVLPGALRCRGGRAGPRPPGQTSLAHLVGAYGATPDKDESRFSIINELTYEDTR